MHFLFTFTFTTWTLLIVLFVVICLFLLMERNKADTGGCCDETEPDGPTPLPVIGSLHLLARHRVPFQAFGELAETYGDVFKIKLGSIPCVVVCKLENIREVLMEKGEHFDGRPNFQRYNLIFNGDKRNSLAFCDWSELQKTRRELLRVHTFPQSFSTKFQQLDKYINIETNGMLRRISSSEDAAIAFKPLLLGTCANIFLRHFCGKRYEHDDPSFQKMIYYFDLIFNEVNQGYAVDYMPWMLPFYRGHFNKFDKWTKHIREFTMEIVNERYSTYTADQENCDYIDTLIETVRREDDKDINLEIAMFSLEDIIGGHAAIANFLTKLFAYVAVRPEVQFKIKEEIKSVTKGVRDVALTDRRSMPYTEAVILETIRLIASPIVPHVASQDSSIAGYKIRKGTMIFLNNFQLNRSPELWNNPEEFCPERFLNDGCLLKPDHFFPFSSGRRCCMGYKMVMLLSFSIVSLTLQTYRIQPVQGCSYDVPIGDLALPFDTFKFKFVL